jgi:hypothetical protein
MAKGTSGMLRVGDASSKEVRPVYRCAGVLNGDS